jgi:hypothetical protein
MDGSAASVLLRDDLFCFFSEAATDFKLTGAASSVSSFS